jgi:hypothetical protein
MASEPEYVLEDELNARELALANVRELAAVSREFALADAEASAGVKATVKMEDVFVSCLKNIGLNPPHLPLQRKYPLTKL